MALRHVIRDTKNFFNIGKLRKQLEFDRWKSIIEQETLNNTEPGISDERYCDNEIVVSLTSYGKRVETVYLAIASMMRQSLKPNRIVLCLAERSSGNPRATSKERARNPLLQGYPLIHQTDSFT